MKDFLRKIGIGVLVIVLSTIALSALYALWGWLTAQFDPFFIVTTIMIACSMLIVTSILYLGNRKIDGIGGRVGTLEDSMLLLISGMKEGGLANRGTPLALVTEKIQVDISGDGVRQSPMVITKKGKYRLKTTRMEEFVQKNKEQLFKMLDETGLTEQYDLEEKCFGLTDELLRKPENSDYIRHAKRYAYQNGQVVGGSGYSGLAALYLRDLYFAHKNIPLEIEGVIKEPKNENAF